MVVYWPWLNSNLSWLYNDTITAIVPHSGYDSTDDQTIVKGGVTEGGKNTASFHSYEWTGQYKHAVLNIKSDDFWSYRKRNIAAKDEKGADDARKVHVFCELFIQQFKNKSCVLIKL